MLSAHCCSWHHLRARGQPFIVRPSALSLRGGLCGCARLFVLRLLLLCYYLLENHVAAADVAAAAQSKTNNC